MRERAYYEQQLALLDTVEGTREAAVRKQEEIETFLAGRLPARLRGDNRVAYDNLVYELNDIIRKMELQQIVDNYDELQTAVTSEEALTQELASVDEIIEYRTRASSGGNTERAREEATGRTTAEPGKTYTATPTLHEVDLTVDAGQAIVNETVEKAKAQIRMNEKGRTTYSGSGLAASKQVATLRALLNSGRTLTREQRNTINGMIRAFERIIDREYDIEAQRREREQGDEEEEVEVVTETEKEVVRKDHIREKIAEQERIRELAQIRIRMMEIRSRQDDPNTPEEERNSLENERAGLQARAEDLLNIPRANPSGPDVEAQRSKLTEAERAALEEERAKVREEAQEEIDYADDVIPVLQELEQLENVPGLDFEAIDAAEVDKRLEELRRRLEELLAQRGDDGNEYDGMSDEDIENRLKEIEQEIQEEWNFRAHQENGMEEHEDDKLQQLQDEQKKLQAEQKRRKEQGKDFEKKEIYSGAIGDGPRSNKTPEEIAIEQFNKYQESIGSDVRFDPDKHEIEFSDGADGENYTDYPMTEFKVLEKIAKEKQRDPKLDREIKRLKNIIKELESLEREKVKVKDISKKKRKKRRKHPEPKPIPGPGGREPPPIPPPPPPGKEDLDYGDYTEERQKKLDLIAQTEDKHIGTWDTIMRRNSKIPIFTKMNIGSAAVGIGAGLGVAALLAGSPAVVLAAPAVVTVGALPIVVSAGMKAVGAIHSAIAGTFGKEKAMREKIDAMDREDFDLLVSNMLENGDIGTEKYGEVYLECIRDRLQKEVQADNKAIREAMDPDVRALAEKLERGEILSVTDRKKLFSDKWRKITANNARFTEFDNALKAKSHTRMNTRGRIFGTFNGDRTEFNQESARLHRKIREAKTQEEIDKAAQEYEEYRAGQVETKRVPRVIAWMVGDGKADKGIINDAQQVQILDREVRGYAEDKREPMFMKNVARLVHSAMAGIVAAMPAVAKVHAQRQTDAANQQIDADNQKNQGANQANQQANQANQQADQANQMANQTNQQANATNASARTEIARIEQDLRSAPSDQAIDDYTRMMINDKFLTSHNGEFVRDQLGLFNHGGSDALAHQDVEALTAQFLQQATRQEKIDFLEQVVIPAYKKTLTEELGDSQVWSYLGARPQFIEDSVFANGTELLGSDLDNVTRVIRTGEKAAQDLSQVQIADYAPYTGLSTGYQAYTDVGHVMFSALSTQIPTVMATTSMLINHIREALKIKPKNKSKAREQQPEPKAKPQPSEEPKKEEPTTGEPQDKTAPEDSER